MKLTSSHTNALEYSQHISIWLHVTGHHVICTTYNIQIFMDKLWFIDHQTVTLPETPITDDFHTSDYKAACETGMWAPTWQRNGVVVGFRVKKPGGFLPGPRHRRSCPSTRTPERWQKVRGEWEWGRGRDRENFPCTLFTSQRLPQIPFP